MWEYLELRALVVFHLFFGNFFSSSRYLYCTPVQVQYSYQVLTAFSNSRFTPFNKIYGRTQIQTQLPQLNAQKGTQSSIIEIHSIPNQNCWIFQSVQSIHSVGTSFEKEETSTKKGLSNLFFRQDIYSVHCKRIRHYIDSARKNQASKSGHYYGWPCCSHIQPKSLHSFPTAVIGQHVTMLGSTSFSPSHRMNYYYTPSFCFISWCGIHNPIP